MNQHTFVVTVTTEAELPDIADEVEFLLAEAAAGYIGEPDRPIGGATVAVFTLTKYDPKATATETSEPTS